MKHFFKKRTTVGHRLFWCLRWAKIWFSWFLLRPSKKKSYNTTIFRKKKFLRGVCGGLTRRLLTEPFWAGSDFSTKKTGKKSEFPGPKPPLRVINTVDQWTVWVSYESGVVHSNPVRNTRACINYDLIIRIRRDKHRGRGATSAGEVIYYTGNSMSWTFDFTCNGRRTCLSVRIYGYRKHEPRTGVGLLLINNAPLRSTFAKKILQKKKKKPSILHWKQRPFPRVRFKSILDFQTGRDRCCTFLHTAHSNERQIIFISTN